MRIGWLRYGDCYLQHDEATALDPYQLPLSKVVYEFTKLKGIPSAVEMLALMRGDGASLNLSLTAHPGLILYLLII